MVPGTAVPADQVRTCLIAAAPQSVATPWLFTQTIQIPCDASLSKKRYEAVSGLDSGPTTV